MYKKTIEVDTKTFVRFWLVILGLGLIGLFIWKALSGLIIVGIAIFLAIAIQPLAERINRLIKRETTSVSSALAYGIVIIILGLIISVIVPVVIDESVQFVKQLPETFENTIGGWEGINSFGQTIGIDNLQDEISNALSNFSNSFVSNFGNVLVTGVGTIAQIATNVVLVLVLTLLFALEGPELVRQFWKTIEGKRKNSSIQAWQKLAGRLVGVVGTYVSKQVTVAVLDGSVVTIAVLLLSFTCGFSSSLALPMGLIALTFYLIPMFGPIIGCILITALLFFSSPVAAIIFLIFYIIYAQIENNLIAPKIQGDALNLPTALVLTAIIIGMYMFGLIGAIIAIPIAGCIRVVLEEVPNLREAEARTELANAINATEKD